MLNNKVLIKPIVEEDKTDGGIILPATRSKDEKYRLAEVIDIADIKHSSLQDFDSKIKIGHIVIYDQYLAYPIKNGKEVYYIISYEAIAGIVSTNF
jgi:chaperonin GroES